MRRAVAAIALMLAPLGSAATIRVSAAASLTDALRDIAKAYEQQHGDSVLLNFGASSLIARQILAGAPADVFFSADEEKMDRLQNGGFILPKTRRDILSNTLVIVVGADSVLRIRSAADLADPSIHNIAIAEPQTVPAGIYAKQYLQKMRVWNRIARRMIPTENVRGALAAVESGNAEAAIVYKTDGMISHRARIAYEVPAADGPKIVYPAAVVTDARERAAAQRFVDFLGSREARAIFTRYGFLLP